MTIAELQKERITCRKDHPTRSRVLGGLLDSAKKIAKEEQRNATDADIVTSAKRTIKALSNTLEQIHEADELYLEYEKEIHILEEFIPKGPSEEEIKKSISIQIECLRKAGSEINNSVMGVIMKNLKVEFKNLDGKLASKLVREAIS